MSRSTCAVVVGSLLLAGCGGSSDAETDGPFAPAALLGVEINPSDLDFGEVLEGSTRTLDVTIHNTTGDQLELTEIDFEPATSADFAILSGPEAVSVAPDATVDVRIEYAPSGTGDDVGTLRITDDKSRKTVVRLNGRGRPVPAPEVQVSAASLAFGYVQIGRSTSLSLTVSNVGAAALDVSEVSLGGAGAAAFDLSPSGWQASLAAGASQVFTVDFYPEATSSYSASVTVRSNDADESVVAVSLSGTGVVAPVPEIEVTPTSLSFGDVMLGSSRTLAFAIRNAGTASLQVTSLGLGAGTTTEFGLVGAPATATVAPGASLSVNVSYVPADLVSDSRTVRIESNDADEASVVVSLSGNGIPVPVPEIDVSLLTLDFGDVQQGSSRTLGVTVRNVGTATLNVSSIGLAAGTGAEFTVTSGSGSKSVAPGSSVSVSVRYAPVDLTSDSGTLRIASNDVDEGTVNVSLAGRGVPVPAPEIDVTPLALAFGNVVVGQSSTLGFTVRNTGTLALQVSRIALGSGTSSEFAISSGGSPVQIAAGGSTAVSVAYTPSAVASRAGTVVVESDDANEAVVTVSLSGSGIAAPAPEIDVSPVSLGFGDVAPGSSKALSLTVRNTGTAALSVSAIGLDAASSAAFAITGGPASASLAAGQSVSVQVTYAPPAEGADQGTLVVRSDDPDEAEVLVPLTGNGVVTAPGLRSIALAWDAPTTNEDGTPLDDLAGYKLYYGTEPHVYTMVLDVGNVLEYPLELAAGSYVFTVTAYDVAGNESDYALELSATLE